MAKIIIYSAITGEKDKPRTDGVLTFDKYSKFKNETMNAKIYKVMPHLFLDTDYSIWIDGNITLEKSPEELVEMLGDKDIAVFPNPYRSNVFKEIDYCILHNIGNDYLNILEQSLRYMDKPMGELCACGVIVRRHTKEMEQLNEKWWAEICRGSVRDQISFPFVFKNKVTLLPFQNNFKDNEYFKRTGHSK